jgi:hypothetical protein
VVGGERPSPASATGVEDDATLSRQLPLWTKILSETEALLVSRQFNEIAYDIFKA